MSAAEVMSSSKPKAQPPLTEAQLNNFRIASNHMSLESIRYAAEIVGYTDLVTATITALEDLIEGRAPSVNCRRLRQEATKATFREEPLLDAILIALKWTSSDGSGEFMVGNIVDPVRYAKKRRNEKHSDEEVYRKLEEIRRKHLTPYYEKLKRENTNAKPEN